MPKEGVQRPDERPMNCLLARVDGTIAEMILRPARQALDEEGLTDITLTDLRDDYVLRLLEQHEWICAAHISGISVRTAKIRGFSRRPSKGKKPPTTHCLLRQGAGRPRRGSLRGKQRCVTV